ncbi:hypothetical protein [Sphingobium sp. DC-2]|uniref:hypothetical protein n=1 Tax=Sphingobium sp. DC-2 TaxID=1303256 RepID=UPI00138DE11D|nr:hypothetical protein [Sphingobium sp. DC-2]
MDFRRLDAEQADAFRAKPDGVAIHDGDSASQKKKLDHSINESDVAIVQQDSSEMTRLSDPYYAAGMHRLNAPVPYRHRNIRGIIP